MLIQACPKASITQKTNTKKKYESDLYMEEKTFKTANLTFQLYITGIQKAQIIKYLQSKAQNLSYSQKPNFTVRSLFDLGYLLSICKGNIAAVCCEIP